MQNLQYRKTPKNSITKNTAVIILKLEQNRFTTHDFGPNDVDRIANSVDPDQTAPLGVVCPDLPV